jgi:hypothetical protein
MSDGEKVVGRVEVSDGLVQVSGRYEIQFLVQLELSSYGGNSDRIQRVAASGVIITSQMS